MNQLRIMVVPEDNQPTIENYTSRGYIVIYEHQKTCSLGTACRVYAKEPLDLVLQRKGLSPNSCNYPGIKQFYWNNGRQTLIDHLSK